MSRASLKRKMDARSVLATARRAGILEGKKEGEHKKAIDIAIEMKKDGLSIAQISKFTKLTIEEIEKL